MKRLESFEMYDARFVVTGHDLVNLAGDSGYVEMAIEADGDGIKVVQTRTWNIPHATHLPPPDCPVQIAVGPGDDDDG